MTKNGKCGVNQMNGQALLLLMGLQFLYTYNDDETAKQLGKEHFYDLFFIIKNPIISRRSWLPILISHVYNAVLGHNFYTFGTSFSKIMVF